VLPHVLALDPATSDDSGLRQAGINALSYQWRRGDYRAAIALGEHLHATFRARLGDAHLDTLNAATILANPYRASAQPGAARTLHEQTLATRRRVLGDDHPDTLTTTINLAATLYDLGEATTARTLLEQTLASYRRVLGHDHPATLDCANGLVRTLRDLGEHATADALEAEFADARARRAAT
jgi:tetratricopeptide (TPR) repeat protein